MFQISRLFWSLHNSYETSHKPYESRMSKKRPFKTGFSKKSKIYGKMGFKIHTEYAAMKNNRIVPDFSVRWKKIISRNSKMDIYKCPKMSKMQISWGLSNRGILYNIIRIVYKSTIVNLSFLQSCRGWNCLKRWKT